MPISFHDDGPRFRVVMEGRLTPEEFAAYHAALLARMNVCAGSGTRFIVLGDATTATPPDSATRRRLAAFMTEHEEVARRTVIASLWTMPSPLQRGVLAAVAWLRRPPIRIDAFATVPEMERRSDELLAAFRADEIAELDRLVRGESAVDGSMRRP